MVPRADVCDNVAEPLYGRTTAINMWEVIFANDSWRLEADTDGSCTPKPEAATCAHAELQHRCGGDGVRDIVVHVGSGGMVRAGSGSDIVASTQTCDRMRILPTLMMIVDATSRRRCGGDVASSCHTMQLTLFDD